MLMEMNEITISIADARAFDQEMKNLRNEVKFLRERNKELRQKSWYSVYEENLNLRNQLKQSAELADSFYNNSIELEKENTHLKEVIASVKAFTEQFTK